ncbi:serine hydrolase domain-containing protein [Perlabentimonas gracilis]|uniref:serine hydrolase domain-containing protein n=1 Tax=Perlabentimonas gracilis TaxID=2715279 RepID=UPI00140A9314|nr:serine hydrolase domain-containing protein [Perlabentimonas gracilis]NHB67170.1 serine hydrolase [Perlabentimonas gracilis]
MKAITILFLVILLLSNCSKSNPTNGIPVKEPSVNIKAIEANIENLMQGYAFHGRFSGTILIAKDDRILYQNSFGHADIKNGTENSNSSVYGIGSVTKQFTATAILKLAQDGRLELTDKISDYFPALGETVSHITIHHLLSMSSGIYEDFSRSKTYDIESIIFPEPHPISTSALVHYFGELTSDSKPGKTYDYSNMNYILLAAIVEKVSGQDYGEFLKENFWQKLGMNSTTFGSENVQENLLAKPYIGLPSHHKTPNYWHDSWVLGAGGAFSSAHDLHTWMYNIANRNVLDSLNTNRLFRKQISTGNDSYAYGWQVGMRKGNEYRFHDGGTLGYVCEAGYFPEHNIYMVVLTNHTHDLMEIGKSVRLNKAIVSNLQNILFDEPFTALPIPKKNSTISISGNFNVGTYNYEISQEAGNTNIITLNNGPSILDLPFWQDLTEDTKRFKKAEKIAVAFGEENFRYVRKKAGLMLKILVSTKKLDQIWDEITGEKGNFLGYNFYRIPGGTIKSSYWVRLVHEKKEIGLRLSFNKRGRMMGMHIDQSFSFGGPIQVEAKVIDDKMLFVDGFKYGYPDAYIIQKEGNWILKTETAELEIDL